jgi:hypothetical protein
MSRADRQDIHFIRYEGPIHVDEQRLLKHVMLEENTILISCSFRTFYLLL